MSSLIGIWVVPVLSLFADAGQARPVGVVDQVGRFDELDHAFLLLQVGDPSQQARLLARQARRGFDGGARHLQDFGDGIDDEAGAHAGEQEDHDALAVVARQGGQVEALALVDDGSTEPRRLITLSTKAGAFGTWVSLSGMRTISCTLSICLSWYYYTGRDTITFLSPSERYILLTQICLIRCMPKE